jgi:hypothetical protein
MRRGAPVADAQRLAALLFAGEILSFGASQDRVYTRLDWAVLGWAGLGWTGLGWARLDWAGLG